MKRVKKVTGLLIILAISMLWVQGTIYAGEMIENGDFESGMSGWDPHHSKGSGAAGVVYAASSDTRPGSTGSKSLQIDTTTEFSDSNWIRQAVGGLKGGHKYRISIWYKVVSGGDPDGPISSVVTRDMKNDTNQDRMDLTFGMTIADTWKYISDEFTAHSSTTPEDYYRMMVHLYPRGEGGKGGRVLVDDFSLLEFTPSAVDAGMVDGVMAKLSTQRADVKGKRSGGVEAGILDGFPYLRNEQVVYLWARAENGGGLLRVRDLRSGKELLGVEEPKAALWNVDMKRKVGSPSSYNNVGVPCEVNFDAGGGEGKLSFRWPRRDMDVKVETRLRNGESLARFRITINAPGGDMGLLTVTFPIVKGIRPLAKDPADDRVLYAYQTGYLRPSPLTTGQALSARYCIEYYMQFTALIGGGRGLYLGEHDGTAAEKVFEWIPDTGAQTLGYSVSHPVLNWGAREPVTRYVSPGAIVLGPFRGGWYDAARIYRRWALTAPWCAKGPMCQRNDYPKWFLNTDYWVSGHLDGTDGMRVELANRDSFDFPITITHDGGYYAQPYQHDLDPEYFPPRPGSINYQRMLGELRARGARVIPYVMGWMWNAASEDYQRRGAKEKGAMLGSEDPESALWAELSPGEENIGMCPASQLWRDKLTEVSVEFVKRYRTGGVYFDYFTAHLHDCFNPSHGHALGGGNYWTSGVNGLFKQVRETVHKIDPGAIFYSEDLAESCIDVLDAHFQGSFSSDAPIWQVVYHDYTQLISGLHWQEDRTLVLGRQWLYGHINQLPGGGAFSGARPETTQWYRNLLRCSHEFARPYLGYGEMLRSPVVSGDLPTLTTQEGPNGPVTARAVEGTAWRASDGSVGIFFFNYENQAHRFTWETNLADIAGFDAAKQLQITQWTVNQGEKQMSQTKGGLISDTADIGPLGLIALKLKVIK